MEDRAEYHTRHPQSDKQNTDRATQVEEVRRSRPTTTQDITVRQTECRLADSVGGLPRRTSQSDKQNADRLRQTGWRCGWTTTQDIHSQTNRMQTERLRQIRLAVDYHTWHLWWGLRGLPAGQRKASANCGMLATDPSTLKHPASCTLSAQASPIV